METFPWRGHSGTPSFGCGNSYHKQQQNYLTVYQYPGGNVKSGSKKYWRNIQSWLEKLPCTMEASIRKREFWVEQAIRNESLRAVVCTSSLDLGVDFAPVETVIQIGGPKGVARFLQRAGRSGHRPGKESVIHFLPTHAMELIEAAAMQKAVRNSAVEDRIPYLNSFDVLIQYLTTLAVSDGFFPDEIYPEIKQTFGYQGITEEQWQWLLNFLVLGSQSLKAYDEYKKVEVEEDGRFKVSSRAVAMRHRFQIGTIVGDAHISVRYQKGGYIGTIEEYFISKLNPGDVFTFAGRNLEFIRIKGMAAHVRNSTKRTNKVPSWMGGRLSFSAKMSELLREELYTAELPLAKQFREIKSLDPMFSKQREESIVPQPHQFLIETFKTRDGYHHIFYPFEGRAIHEGMSSLLAYRISLLTPLTCSLAFNDYGFELLSDKMIDIQAILDNDLFTPDYMLSDLQKSLNSNEMARRKFRDVAVISGMVFTGYPEKGVKMKHLQSSSELLFDVFKDFEDDNLLYQQAFTETFEHQLEEGRLRLALERIANQEIVWKKCERPTPFSFPIITDRLREKLSNEKLADRIKRMTAILTK